MHSPVWSGLRERQMLEIEHAAPRMMRGVWLSSGCVRHVGQGGGRGRGVHGHTRGEVSTPSWMRISPVMRTRRQSYHYSNVCKCGQYDDRARVRRSHSILGIRPELGGAVRGPSRRVSVDIMVVTAGRGGGAVRMSGR